MSYLTEAFKQMELLESEQFTFDKNGATKLANFLDDDMLKDFEAIIDPEAETKEEIKDSYMGNVICRCPICKSLIYRDPEEIVIDEEAQLANIEDECQFCFEAGGYEIVGQVAPYEEVTVESEEPVAVEVDGKPVENGDTDPETEEDREPLEEDLSNLEKLYRAYPELKDEDKSKRHARDNEDIEDCQRFPVEGTKQRNLVERRCAKRRHVRDNEDLEDSQRYPIESPAPAQTGLRESTNENFDNSVGTKAWTDKVIKFYEEAAKKLGATDLTMKENQGTAYITLKKDGKELSGNLDWQESHVKSVEDAIEALQFALPDLQESLKESMEDISITTDDQVIKVKATPRADKETIQPVEEETKDVIEAPVEDEEVPEEEMVELDELDEESFDSLGESYLKEVYENVSSFKTSSIKSKNDKLMIEGIISFNSGKKSKTRFIFEAKEATKSGKLKFSGLNENITKNKNAFTLTGSLTSDNKLILESLNYNYSAKNSDGKAKRLYGTVRTIKA